MKNSLLALGALAALTVFGAAAACVWESQGTASPSFPFQIRIDRVEARGQLNVEEYEELFFLNKENELIFAIPKEVSKPRLTFRNFSTTIQNTIELESNNPDILLCYIINPPYEDECQTEITTNRPLISIWPQNLVSLANAAGVLDQKVAALLFSFELDGKIDGHQFLVKGRVTYDNTAESKSAIYEGARSQTARNQVLIGVLLFASALI